MAARRSQLPRTQDRENQDLGGVRPAGQGPVQPFPRRIVHRGHIPRSDSRQALLPLRAQPPPGAVPHQVRRTQGQAVQRPGQSLPHIQGAPRHSPRHPYPAGHLAPSAGHDGLCPQISGFRRILQRSGKRSLRPRPPALPGLPEEADAHRSGRGRIPGRPWRAHGRQQGRRPLPLHRLLPRRIRTESGYQQEPCETLLPASMLLRRRGDGHGTALQPLHLVQGRRIPLPRVPARCGALAPLFQRRPRPFLH